MSDKNSSLLADLDAYRRETGTTQLRLGEFLKVSQGHLSKILAQKAPISGRMRISIQLLLGKGASDKYGDPLELEALRLLRSSRPFRELMHAAIKMHNSLE